MSGALPVALLLLLTLTVGYALALVVTRTREIAPRELAALCLALGLGAYPTLLLWASLAGLRPTRGLIAGIGIAFALVAVSMHVRGRGPKLLLGASPGPSHKWIVFGSWLLIVASCSIVTRNALAQGMEGWDAFAIWGLKAKLCYFETLRGTSYFHDPSLAYNNLSYPLLLPFQYAAVYGMAGHVDDKLAKWVCVATYLATVLLAYACLRWRLGRAPASGLAALLACVPTLMVISNSGYADASVALFYLGSVHYLVRWHGEQKRDDLLLAILFAVFLAFTKNEGLALAVTNGLVLLLVVVVGERQRDRGPGLSGAAGYFAGFLLLSAPYLLWKLSVPGHDESHLTQASLAGVGGYLARIPGLLAGFGAEFARFDSWGAVWVLLLAAALLGRRAFGDSSVRLLWLSFAGGLAVYFLVYMVTPFSLDLLFHSTLHRLYLQILPAAILLIGLHWATLATPKARPRNS